MPIRIRDRSTAESIARPRPGNQPLARTTTALTSFGEQLLAAQETAIRRDLDKLYLDVDEEGRRFAEHPTPEMLKRYRERVRQFIAYVVKNGLKLRSSLSARELHQIVDKVDEELLAMADALLARERPLLDLATKVEHVNGMLLDLKA
jgi:hypothetical protein